jgi:hypothetical protein
VWQMRPDGWPQTNPALLFCSNTRFYVQFAVQVQNVDRQNVNRLIVDRQNFDRQNVDQQNVDQQNVDQQNVDQQNVNRQNVNRQNVEVENAELLPNLSYEYNLTKPYLTLPQLTYLAVT